MVRVTNPQIMLHSPTGELYQSCEFVLEVPLVESNRPSRNFQRAFPQAERGLRRGNALAQATEIRSRGRISTQRDATFTAKSHEASWCHEASSEASRSRAQGEHASAESSQCDPHVWRFLCINRSRYETSKTVARHPSSARSAAGRGKLSFDCGDGTSTSPAGGCCEDGDSRVLPETNFEEKYSH